MMPQWKRSKGLGNVCPKCNGTYSDEEFDFDEDLCLGCLFPESGIRQPAMFTYDLGDPTNTTPEAELLKDIEYRPTVQSEASKKAKREYDWRNYGRYEAPKGKIKPKKR